MRHLSESFRSPSSASHLIVLGAAYASLSEVARRSGQHDARIMPGSEGLERSCRLSAQVEGLQILAHFAKPLRKPFFSGKIDAFKEILTTLQEQPVLVDEIGRAHVCTPVTNAHLVCRLLLEKKKHKHNTS